jgi:hypothetical protein
LNIELALAQPTTSCLSLERQRDKDHSIGAMPAL